VRMRSGRIAEVVRNARRLSSDELSW
jgi:hypothetical protein